MTEERDDLVLRPLREMRSMIGAQAADIASIKEAMRHQSGRVDELLESTAIAMGLAGHANARHDSVAKRLDERAQRIERLENASPR